MVVVVALHHNMESRIREVDKVQPLVVRADLVRRAVDTQWVGIGCELDHSRQALVVHLVVSVFRHRVVALTVHREHWRMVLQLAVVPSILEDFRLDGPRYYP